MFGNDNSRIPFVSKCAVPGTLLFKVQVLCFLQCRSVFLLKPRSLFLKGAGHCGFGVFF